MTHLDKCNIRVDIQHTFRKSRSFKTQLLQTVNDFALNLQNKFQRAVAVLDFSKVFDKVDHDLLLSKFQYYGIRNNHLEWMKSFLTNCTQKVIVECYASSSIDVTSGVSTGHSPCSCSVHHVYK